MKDCLHQNTWLGMTIRLQILQRGPWFARHEWHDIGLKNYKNLSRWYINIAKREAVIRGYQFMNKKELPPQL